MQISIVGIIARNPRLILLAGHEKKQARKWILKWEKWPAIDAVSHQQVKPIEADIVNRPTQRFIEGTRTICELTDAARHTFHPDR
jgi:iron complex transport system substrate-binding protein